MRKQLTVIAMLAAATLPAKDIFVNTPRTTLLLGVEENKPVHISYYGEKITDANEVYRAFSIWEEAYPAFGLGNNFTPALSVKHADGNMSTELVYQSDTETKEGNATVYTITMKDKQYNFLVDICYRTYDNCDVIEAWSEIHNQEKKPVTLLKYASAYLPMRQNEVWVSHEHGAWGAEAEITEEPLRPGIFEINDLAGNKNAYFNRPNIMLSLDGKPQENSGRTIGAVLCWSGNFRFTINTRDKKIHHLVAGIDDTNSQYTIGKGETFTTPVLALAYSEEGKGGVSRSYHRWARLNNKIHNGTALRKTLLNSWEGVYLNVTEEGMLKMMDGVKEVGAELFVMDDGWFGNKYKRNIDNCALGDWVVDKEKLPHGIEGLLAEAKKLGIKFGIWLEPEMSNTKSELFEKHPEWVIKAPHRDLKCGRGGTQVVLDLGNPKVQDFVFSIVDDMMTKYPEIDYIKWDSNMKITNHGSQYLTANNQSHLYIEYHRGLEKVLQRIRAKYPDLTIQDCASGGGRVNWGTRPYFDEFWTSDNTDALQRVYMQWGTSYFFPAIAMASHISNAPNHQTARTVPLKYRTDVAMSGRLGMEIQPKVLSEADKDQCRKAIADYKRIRPIVQFGDLYRLQSPYEKKGVASLMYVTDAKDKAVFFWWKTESFCNQHLPRIPMAGLDPQKRYRITELNRIDKTPLAFEGKTFSGEYLMQNGLEIPYGHNADWGKANEWASRVLLLETAE